jgi:hypothetical protein
LPARPDSEPGLRKTLGDDEAAAGKIDLVPGHEDVIDGGRLERHPQLSGLHLEERLVPVHSFAPKCPSA